ncbi:MAG: O-acetyl-ADP-ribose deacetylase [Pirellulales bacterium]
MPLSNRLQLVSGDITVLEVDAIVTAANAALAGGGGVDGAVHRAAGPHLLAECRTLNGCPSGEARITAGYGLAARHVIHAVGPIYAGGKQGEAETLAGAYRSSLQLAAEHAVRTIAFPCISTGVYGYPQRQACQIAIDTVVAWLGGNALPEVVTFCCFGEPDTALYRQRLIELGVECG